MAEYKATVRIDCKKCEIKIEEQSRWMQVADMKATAKAVLHAVLHHRKELINAKE